jgi:hypothetical protein
MQIRRRVQTSTLAHNKNMQRMRIHFFDAKGTYAVFSIVSHSAVVGFAF